MILSVIGDKLTDIVSCIFACPFKRHDYFSSNFVAGFILLKISVAPVLSS